MKDGRISLVRFVIKRVLNLSIIAYFIHCLMEADFIAEDVDLS